jgi:murein DD-endopeptidase MepM/ murein hydrolase activator NlpD
MNSTRYTILLANRKTGAVRRFTLSRRVMMLCGGSALVLPLLVGMGSGGASQAEVEVLRSANESLRLENDSYRAATGELTEQISSLQTALSQLGDQTELDPATRQAISRLPAVVKSRAAGGNDVALASTANAAPVLAPKPVPEGTFGILKDLLGSLESRLASVRSQVESQQALGRATPSTWPIVGWLTSVYGNRKDPFTGQPDFHTGLDISAEYGTLIKATADGIVESAGYNGNYGNSVVLDHGYGIGTRFGHMSRISVRPGQKVVRGEVVGYVGATGRATSSHLHYEILMNGQPINPLRFLLAR